jgi:predicted 3-demethylubiquinone-9 3-methyltransferase (glyoxalase superfamily)
MQKIIPHLWYDKEAKEAADFYVSTFGNNSKVTRTTTLHDTPSGDAGVVSFEIWGYKFMAISAGPYFKFNPSISMMVNFDPSKDKDARTRIDEIWNKLSEGGKVLMPLDKYPYSERYGWVQDKYGMTWQLILTNPEGEERPLIIPCLLFTEQASGKAEEAINFYLSVFKDSKSGGITKYPAGMTPEKEGTVMFGDFRIEGQWFAAMDSAREHGYTFNEAVSLMIRADNQEEIDYYWGKLSAVPEAEQCGWLKDKFGVSWQVSPSEMDKMMGSGTPEQVNRVTQAFLKMKKFDLDKLKEAYEGK